MRTGDYQNAEYDRRLAEFKAQKAKLKQEQEGNSGSTNRSVKTTPSNSGFRQENRFR